MSKRADRARLYAGPNSERPQRFRIDIPGNLTEIELAKDGQFRSITNGKGVRMSADNLTFAERQELSLVVANAQSR